MITIDNQTVDVKCGKGKGTVSMGCKENKLIIQQLLSELEIGSEPSSEDIKELPKVVVEFFKTESIDVLIKVLKSIKDNMEGPKLYLAC